MRCGVTETFQVRHLRAHFGSFSFVIHKMRDLTRSQPLARSLGLPVYVAVSPTAPFSTPKAFGARNDKGQVRATPNDGAAPGPSSARAALKFFVRQTLSKSAEINHEEHEGHKEFAPDRVTCRTGKIQATDTGLISARLFTYIVSCLR